MEKAEINKNLNLISHYYTIGRYAQAEQLAREVLREHPDNAEAIYNLGNCFDKQTGRELDAFDAFQYLYNDSAYGYSAKCRVAQMMVFDALRLTSKLHSSLWSIQKQGCKIFEEVISEDPNDASGYAYYANALIYMGKKRKGIKYLRKALEIAPESTFVEQVRAQAEAIIGVTFPLKKKGVNGIYNLDMKESDRLLLMAKYYMNRRRFFTAQKYLKDAIVSKPDDPELVSLYKKVKSAGNWAIFRIIWVSVIVCSIVFSAIS